MRKILLALLLPVLAQAAPYAVVAPGGAVLNIVNWDGSTAYSVSPNTLVATGGSANAQIGGTYSGGVFTASSLTSIVPAVSACGTSPSIDPTSTNRGGLVSAGSGTVNSCTITFSSASTIPARCAVISMQSSAGLTYSLSSTAITVTALSLTSVKLYYICEGL